MKARTTPISIILGSLIIAGSQFLPVHAITTTRPAIMLPLREAVLLAGRCQYKEALGKIKAVYAIPNQNPQETEMVGDVWMSVIELSRDQATQSARCATGNRT